MFVWLGEMSRDKTISQLWGKETFVISTCFKQLSSSFVQKVTKTRNSSPSRESMRQSKSTAVLPYVKGKPEPLRCYLQQLRIHTVFEFNTTLRRHLVWPKDTVNPARQDSMVYRIPCECGKSTLLKQEDLCKRGQEGYTFSPCPDLCCF